MQQPILRGMHDILGNGVAQQTPNKTISADNIL